MEPFNSFPWTTQIFEQEGQIFMQEAQLQRLMC